MLEYVKDLLSSALRKTLRHIEQDVREIARAKMRQAARYVVKELVAIFTIILGALFFMLALMFALREYFQISLTISFLIFGSIILLVGIILKLKN